MVSSLLGRLLELSLVTADTGDAWQQYQKLGFEAAPTGDIWPHAYGVVTCENLALGLHAVGEEALSITFVRPEVAALHRELSAAQVDIEHARLGADVFNELTLREPGGVALRVLEARSFSPPQQMPQQTALGRFISLSLPGRDMDAAQAFWHSLGHECTPITEPWEGLRVSGLPLSVHARRALPEPALVFHASAQAMRSLTASSLERERKLPALRDMAHERLRLPADVAALVFEL